MFVRDLPRFLLDLEQDRARRNPTRGIRRTAEDGHAALVSDLIQRECFAVDADGLRPERWFVPTELVEQLFQLELAE